MSKAIARRALLGAGLGVAATPVWAAPAPVDPVRRAVDAARREPRSSDWQGGVHVYPYAASGLFVVYAAPGRVTDILLEPGEQLVRSNAVAAGDTDRWIIGDTASGADGRRQVHVLVKPSAAGLTTDLLIHTDRRAYRLELRSGARWMPAVGFSHPVEAKAASVEPAWSLPPEHHTAYRIEGAAVPWRPERVWDDGQRTVIAFAPNIVSQTLPPLFIRRRKRGRLELVNYRVRDRWMVVDRIVERGELRFGGKGESEPVVIVRESGQ